MNARETWRSKVTAGAQQKIQRLQADASFCNSVYDLPSDIPIEAEDSAILPDVRVLAICALFCMNGAWDQIASFSPGLGIGSMSRVQTASYGPKIPAHLAHCRHRLDWQPNKELLMRIASVFTPVLLLVACTQPSQGVEQAASAPTIAAEAGRPAAAAAGPSQSAAPTMTAADPGGFTEEGFVFHSTPGSKHVVRLPSPGTDTWQPVSSGEPAVKQSGSRKETTPDGKAALVFEYEMLQPGNAAIEFQRLEDGEVEGKRTINFMVH